jgi:hypothetical protein
MKLDGPTFRHRNALTTEESSVCADNGAASTTAAVTVRNRNRFIVLPAVWEVSTERDYSARPPAARAD